MLTALILASALHFAPTTVDTTPAPTTAVELGNKSNKSGKSGKSGKGSAPVPEPGTLALLGLGAAGIGAGMRRRRKARIETGQAN